MCGGLGFGRDGVCGVDLECGGEVWVYVISCGCVNGDIDFVVFDL